MESNKKIQVLGFVLLLATFALPAALASSSSPFEKDVVSASAVQAVLKMRGLSKLEDDPVLSALAHTKIIISNPAIEAALFNSANMKAAGNGAMCPETCAFIPCTYTALTGCSCSSGMCYENSLQPKY